MASYGARRHSLISWLISIRTLNSYIIQTGEEVETREILIALKEGQMFIMSQKSIYLMYEADIVWVVCKK